MRSSSRPLIGMIIAFAVAALGAGGYAIWMSQHGASQANGQSAAGDSQNAAGVAAKLPTDRPAVLDPRLTDDPRAVPVYPPGTSITVDQGTWAPIGAVASAYATVSPPGKHILMHFSRIGNQWYVSLIEEQ
jgi:hypothetical protein